MIVTKHSKNKKEPKASKHIFESKIKAVDKNVNFAGEKADSYSENSLLSIFKYWQSKLNSNESTNNHIYPEGIYKQPYNKRKNEKRAFRSKVNYGKKYKVKTIVVDKNMKRDVLMKNWSFPSKKSKCKKMKYPIIQSYEMTIGKLYLDDGRLMRSFTKLILIQDFIWKLNQLVGK